MRTVICTLFENQYHHGVAALTNSLYNHGFRGEVFAGYKGNLPEWASPAGDNPNLEWEGGKTLKLEKDINLHFLPLKIDFHLTNYKPDFMLSLLDGPAKTSGAIAYFDPDIVIKCRWSFFENWLKHGVALVHEVVSNDMPFSHPTRQEWRKFAAKCNFKIFRNIDSYINGGFCGVARENREFLQMWSDVLKEALIFYKPNLDRMDSFDKSYPFCFFDQDALNVAAMCCESPISEMGPEGMDFVPGGWTMSHAVGASKPWSKKFIKSVVHGFPPSSADKAYWANVYTPITPHHPVEIRYKKTSLLLASLIGRFYRRA